MIWDRDPDVQLFIWKCVKGGEQKGREEHWCGIHGSKVEAVEVIPAQRVEELELDRDHRDWSHWLEAWLSGYNAPRREGGEALLRAAQECWWNSGRQRARAALRTHEADGQGEQDG